MTEKIYLKKAYRWLTEYPAIVPVLIVCIFMFIFTSHIPIGYQVILLLPVIIMNYLLFFFASKWIKKRLNRRILSIWPEMVITFLILSFLFFVRPLVRWLTEYSFGDMEMFKQLPRTVGELENNFDSADPKLIFRDQASQLISNGDEASMGVVRDWIKEN